MRTNEYKTTLRTTLAAIATLLLAVGFSFAQQQINLSAGPTTITLPDGSTAPMWGYNCGAPVSGSSASCAALNPNAAAGSWSPVVITVPTGQGLTINLTNNLSFTTSSTTPSNNVPTSIVIVGQVGGGLGSSPTYVLSPVHSQQQTTWPIANTPGAANNPPPQGPRVQSFATEVEATGVTPGTGQCASGCALTWAALRPGTYLLESGTHPSIQVPMGLIGMLVVTGAPSTSGSGNVPGTAYPGVNYGAEIPLEFSEIDPVQNKAVATAVSTPGFSETMVWSGQPNGCGNPSSASYNQCYPPAVNYTPFYYLINGVAFNKTNAATSLFAATQGTATGTITGNVLVRLVNAGLRMHVPSIVGPLTGTAAVPGFSILAEDGNLAPGIPKVQSDVFMAAGKTFDVMINAPASSTPPAPALAVFDRELSLSANSSERDAGMLAYISVNGAGLPTYGAGVAGAAVARKDTYNSLVAGQTLMVSDPSKGVIANDTNVYGVQLDATNPPTNGTVTLNVNGTFTYVPSGTATSDSFGYCANGTTQSSATPICTTVTLGGATIESASGIVMNNITYTAKTSTYLSISAPGVLSVDKDIAGYPLTVPLSSVVAPAGLTVTMAANGGFIATAPGTGTYQFTYKAQNSQGTLSSAATVTLNFPQPSNLAVTIYDPKNKTNLTDYRWIIEEDKTFYVNPACTTNSSTAVAGCPQPTATTVPPTFGVNFHTSHMEFVAQGCTGTLSCEAGQSVLGVPMACDVGNGVCTAPDLGTGGEPASLPSAVALDPGCGFATSPCTSGSAPYPKRYYISILPGDAAIPFITANATSGHGMGGAPISWNTSTNSWNPVTVLTEPNPYQPGKLSVQVFEDDFPLNGEQDAGGGIDVIASNEPGLGGFNIVLWDDMGGSGDVTGQMTYDMFNQPLSNSLAGTVDPATGYDACPISPQVTANTTKGDGTQQGITGMIVTCPKYESDGATLSPLAGQAVIANLMPGRFSVQAYPGAQRIANGEEWLQTNTLDGQHPHDSFVRIGEPSYFQEYGPAGFHVSIGFASPQIINARRTGVCGGTDLNLTAPNCTNTVTGRVTTERMSRTPDQRLYSSGSRDAFYWTQCFVSLGDPDGEDFMFTKCDANGNFTFKQVPSGSWRLSIFDQWNDQLMDGLSTPVNVANGNNQTVNMNDVPVQQWQANVYTRTFVDDNKNGIYESGELGIPFLNTTVRYRDGSRANNTLTDFTGTANFNETFPLFSWYVVETDTTRYKTTGIHTVYDAGGPADGTKCGGAYPACETGTPYDFFANTIDPYPLPTSLSVPGAAYCGKAACTTEAASFAAGMPVPSTGTPGTPTTSQSTGRIDPPWVTAEGWQGFSGQSNFIEFGKAPYATGENGGINGHVVYASTRPFDDPQMNVQQPWEPLVPHVIMNLYQEGVAADGVTPTLTLVDTTQTSSWDDWAQGFRSDGMPNMNCPGQANATNDLFFYTLYNQPNYLDLYNSYYNGGTLHSLPYNSEYKCYDAMHNWNQLQPAPYDGMYSFPSVLGIDPATGKLNTALTGGVGSGSAFAKANMPGTNCTICVANPDTSDPWRVGNPMLPAGKYVVEVVLPPGYELVKEEDKNILIGDNFIAPVTQEFGGLGNIFILPDQASVASLYDESGSGYNANNPQNPTQSLGANPNNQIVPGFLEPVWPCVGQARVVPDYISLFPQSTEVAPFAGATRHLCDRKEVTLGNQMGAIAKFSVYTSTHIASKFTGLITDDFTSEFDPFAPVFGEKFSPPNMPVSIRDFAGNETARVYSDQWGAYNGLTYSSWEVNPPNPTGYSPTMMVQCMNDAGPIPGPNGTMINDPLFNPLYSQFCYELPYMPGQTDYLDTPVVPTAGLVGAGYNNPDCAYPTLTPAVASVTSSDAPGPWALSAGGVVASVNVTKGGSGYASAPSVSFSGGGGSGASGTAVISGSVATLTLTNRGSGYTASPTVAFTGGGSGSGAAATALAGFPVASATVTAGGANYSSAPSVSFSAPGNGGTTATGSSVISGSVATLTIGNRGSGYTSAPTVTFTGGAGSGAAATAGLGFPVVSVSVTNGGSGYAGRPNATFTAPGTAGGTTATAATFLAVTAIVPSAAGSGYTSVPSVSISGGGGSGAAATAVMQVGSATVPSGGSGYTSAPSVSISGGGGSGATATATISNNTHRVTAVNITNGGSGYTSQPTISFSGGGGTGAAATAFLNVQSVNVTASGSGYTGRPSATFSGGGGSGANASNGSTTGTFLRVNSLTLTNPGAGYPTTPTLTIQAPSATGSSFPGATTATGSANLSNAGGVYTLTLTSGGSGYTSTPTVGFSGGGGSGATAFDTILSKVVAVNISNGGSRYTSAPTITFGGGGGGSGAAATANLAASNGVIVSLSLTSGGSGYSSAPTVTISGGGGSGATATDTISAMVVAVNVSNGGSGYTSAPNVAFSGGGGSGAAATALVPPGSTLTITALGDQTVNNYGYAGPQATTSPFNQKTVTRHYGFGGTQGTVTIGGQNATVNSWSDTQIVVQVPGGVPACTVQQQVQYGGPALLKPAQCGQLQITAATGQQSVDTVTVTIGGKQPTVLAAGQTIQSAIDAAAPGDMIIVPPGTYRELLIMWKPVRLQGVGAASTVVDASTHPAGQLKLDPWRASVNCLFGLALNGQPNSGVFDSTGAYSCPSPTSPTATGTGPDGNTWNYFYGGPNFPTMVVDRVPLEGILGWDATVNGNLAEQLQEPSLMGAYEGAAVSVLSKGINIPAGALDVFGSGAEAAFPTGTTLLTGFVGPNGGALKGDLNPICHTSLNPFNGTNPYPSNFMCNPSSIDGLGLTDASQGGGGIFVHAWGHNLQIANNRIFNNAGTLSGGVSLGQGESPEAYLNGTPADSDPGSCFTPLPGQTNTPLFPANTQLPYCLQLNVNMHNNMIVNNSSTGDELFSGTPAGAGGVSICTGSDFYNFNYNWVCGNMSTGDGGGVGHIGFSWNGNIQHNTFQFNQATNPSIQSNGGGLIVMGAAPDASISVNGVATECGSVTDNDCVPGLSDGAGPGLFINANVFEGNSADAGSGGGLRLQAVNGTDVARFPSTPSNWYQVQIQNNIINNNVAGWDGAGVSLEDSLAVTLINNTISSNDTTASSGVLFNTLGAPLASSQSPSPTCQSQNGGSASCPQPAGLVTMQNSPQLTSSFTTGAITCPPGNYAPGSSPTNGTCIRVSYPALYNNLFWQNRSFQVGVGGAGAGAQNQQNVVTLFNAGFNGGLGSVAGTQNSTGSCPSGSSYWDIGVRNDTGPTNHGSGFTLNPLYGVLTSNTGYSATNLTSNPAVVSQYCNGSRVPPQATCSSAAGQPVACGWQVPPGIADAVVPNPVFSLTPAATVDEGNNWINISWGPLSMVDPATSTASNNVVLGNYSLSGSSPAINYDSCSTNSGVCTETINASGVAAVPVPTTDFFGNPRPDNGRKFDVGAAETPGH